MEEEEVADTNPGDSNEGNEIVASKGQDDNSEVSLQEKQAIFEQSHNSVVGHPGWIALIKLSSSADTIGRV